MRLRFSVIWFDDDEEYFDSLILEPLEKEIRLWGFEPVITKVTTPEEFMKHMPFDSFDLIVVDLNLEGYEDGQEFINKIRANAVYTEVIFYTAGKASDLWDAVREKELEGIFVSSRNEVLSKIGRVGRQSVRKILDLDNMRGLVMAEVGELDHLIDEIVTIGFSGLREDQQKKVFKRFYEGAMQQHNQNIEKLNDFIENPDFETMLSLCDSYKRWQSYTRLCKYHSLLDKEKRIDSYNEEVLGPRNFLAHGIPAFLPDGGYLFQLGTREFTFDKESSLELRRTILGYKNKLSEVAKLLTSSISTS